MLKDLKDPIARLQEALQPLNVSDFIRPPAEYIALYTPISLPPLATRPDYGNLPKPHYSITYGECVALHRTIDKISDILQSGKKTAAATEALEDLSYDLIDQLREIAHYADYLTHAGTHAPDSDAYHLTTFINNFTNSTPRQKSQYPEFSGSTRHRLTVDQLSEILSAALDVEKVVNPQPRSASVVYLDPTSGYDSLEPTAN